MTALHLATCTCVACIDDLVDGKSKSPIIDASPDVMVLKLKAVAFALKFLRRDVRGLLHEASMTPCTEPARPHGQVCGRLCESWHKKLREVTGG